MTNVYDHMIFPYDPSGDLTSIKYTHSYVICTYMYTNVYINVSRILSIVEAPNWEVDHNGKIVKLPRPVHGLRVWDSNSGSYKEISPVMAGLSLLFSLVLYRYIGEVMHISMFICSNYRRCS